ncbi:MAG TPA: nucleotidyltransferase domain-containing protein [Candidatus Wallbacteria bacterium]|nr:nucleotidyltransferase domain-containing protein [Candidatus Wallbacteria bacterium]
MTKELKIKENRIKKLLSELELKLRNLFKDNLKKIILYGSYARGTYDDESDIDVMVLIDGVNKKDFKKHITDIRLELTINYSILPSITIETESEYYKNIDIQFLFKNIESEGVELYAA